MHTHHTQNAQPDDVVLRTLLEQAATRIQKVTRMLIAAHKAKKLAYQEAVFLGMEDRRIVDDESPFFKLQKTCIERKKVGI